MKEKKLEKFFEQFPNQRLMHLLWNIVEDARIEYRMKQKYDGLKQKIGDIDKEFFKQIKPQKNLTPKERAVEQILHLTCFGKTKTQIPKELEEVVQESYKIFKNIENMQTTVNDSIKAATEVYGLLDNLKGNFTKEPPPINMPVELEVVMQRKREMLDELNEMMGGGLSDEELEEILENKSGTADEYIKEQLKKQGETGEDTLEESKQTKSKTGKPSKDETDEAISKNKFYIYDEWDYKIEDYRYKWCVVEEKKVPQRPLRTVQRILEENRNVLTEIKKQFQMIKPERLKKIKKQEYGEEIDLDAAVEALVDQKAGMTPSEKIYIQTIRKERDISTAFVIDLSGSTGMSYVLNTEREALLLMMEAIHAVGDDYAVYGYDSNSRLECNFYVIKDFDEKYNEGIKQRMEALSSRSRTRTGPALRHATHKLHERGSKSKLLFHITDAHPTCGDFYSNTSYAIRDVKKCLMEAKSKGIFPLQIVINPNPPLHDMKVMYANTDYIILKEIKDLPKKMITLYKKITT